MTTCIQTLRNLTIHGQPAVRKAFKPIAPVFRAYMLEKRKFRVSRGVRSVWPFVVDSLGVLRRVACLLGALLGNVCPRMRVGGKSRKSRLATVTFRGAA